MRVLILSQYYAPEPITKPVDLAAYLMRCGHDVTVLTGFPNYPSGRLYDGYRLAPVRREVVDGITIVRAFELPYHGRRALGRLANYGSFMLAAPLAALGLGRFDVVYVWHPPLTVGVAAWLVSRITGAPFVYDVQDIWPDAAVVSGLLRPGVFVRVLSAMERFVYRRAASILVPTEPSRQNLLGKGVPPARVQVLSHWAEPGMFAAADPAAAARIRAAHGWGGRFVVMFAGNLGIVQGLETILRAAEALRDDPVQVAFVGDGVDRARLITLARDLGIEASVTFVERQPAAAMPEFFAAADALVLHLRRSPLAEYVIPFKTMSYLAGARPLIAAAGGPAGDLVTRAGAGVAVPSDDPGAMAEAIRQLCRLPADERAAMGGRGRAFAQAHLAAHLVLPLYERALAAAAPARHHAAHA